MDEIDSLYAIRAILDPAALAMAGLPGPEQLKRLDSLNHAIDRADDPARIIELDDQWHLELLSHCPNTILLDLIQQFMHRTRRYEHAYMRRRGNVEVALDEHERILDALKRGDLDAACDALRANMQSAPDPIQSDLGSPKSSEPVNR